MRWLVLAGLAILLVTLVSLSHTRQSGPVADPASALLAGAAVPPDVASTLRRSCYDCHSQDTRWPWYSNLPIASGLIERDVAAGRGQLDFSRWADYNPYDRAGLLDSICARISEGRMPLKPYLLMHRDARLSARDSDLICRWTRDEIKRLVQGGS